MNNGDVNQRNVATVVTLLILLVPSLCIELFDSFRAANSLFSFSFHRQLIIDGQWWRVLTGHFDHLGWSHLMLNAAFLGLLLFTFSGLGGLLRLIVLLVVFSLGISLLIWYLSPELNIYVGLSGILYGLLVYALYKDLAYPSWLRWLVFGGLLAKVAYEYLVGASPQVSELIGGNVATDVHIYGVMLGVLSVIVIRLFRL